MFPHMIAAIAKGLYEAESDIFVVDTHSKGEFCANVSVARQKDDRLPYSRTGWNSWLTFKVLGSLSQRMITRIMSLFPNNQPTI